MLLKAPTSDQAEQKELAASFSIDWRDWKVEIRSFGDSRVRRGKEGGHTCFTVARSGQF